MKIYGMNHQACRGKYVVAVKVGNSKYFHMATSNKNKAEQIAQKVKGIAIYIE